MNRPSLVSSFFRVNECFRLSLYHPATLTALRNPFRQYHVSPHNYIRSCQIGCVRNNIAHVHRTPTRLTRLLPSSARHLNQRTTSGHNSKPNRAIILPVHPSEEPPSPVIDRPVPNKSRGGWGWLQFFLFCSIVVTVQAALQLKTVQAEQVAELAAYAAAYAESTTEVALKIRERHRLLRVVAWWKCYDCGTMNKFEPCPCPECARNLKRDHYGCTQCGGDRPVIHEGYHDHESNDRTQADEE
ncbi:uncharacterized protein EI97DRAFT_442217 [Westerdykella ornata]|uniref:RanBP2-type domain-containing protein n=1 Tax=Westerdykella ornata TaxID=318751 RepID=A0A6A6JMH0_WESOR|nr:uncharacterized protein EI97DRAFT_442217 [Westerdykella ornata]KAF2276856.1 hypothetical protein EI97DRAFT_442217 [Westerdykella ornata]